MNIDRQQFTEWLESKEVDKTVGHTCDDTYCPLARYLTERQGSYVSVTISGAEIWDTQPIITGLPNWARHFIVKVDRSKSVHMPVKAYEALVILKELPK